jgi:hypothetical protein
MTTPDPILFRYLLGQLTPDEEAALDERAFVDDDWDEERAAAADELIDAYLTGALTADQRTRFETRFLASSEYRERFRLLRDLRTVMDRGRADPVSVDRSPGRPWLALAVAAALIAALAALALLVSGRAQAPPRLATTGTPVPSPTPTPSPSPEGSPTRAPEGATATVSLPDPPGATRVAVDSTTRVVRFRVPTPAAGPDAYVARVRRDGRTLWEEGDLEASGPTLVLDVPASVLSGDSIELALEPDTTRSGSSGPRVPARIWPLRILRR